MLWNRLRFSSVTTGLLHVGHIQYLSCHDVWKAAESKSIFYVVMQQLHHSLRYRENLAFWVPNPEQLVQFNSQQKEEGSLINFQD